MENIMVNAQEIFAQFGINFIAAILIFVIGRWIAKFIRKVLEKIMTRKEVDATVVNFICNIVYVILLIFVILGAIHKVGVQTASLIAVLGAAGLAVGLALQGSLSNFAAGILLIIFRPVKVDDFVEAAGVTGVVEKVDIFTTQLKTPDNKTVIIPNAQLTSNNITNYTTKGTRRVDLVIGVSYSDNIDKVRSLIEDELKKDGRILTDPAPTIVVLELADSSVNFGVRPWTKTDDYWDVYFDLTENLKKRFDTEGVSIPFPQHDVHVFQEG
ncbi:MAG: mechanosensitive ion channel [Deltaproteobacteria bacterium]|nr:mechanosensitive ion channel [Deltaproteobacteria bacterium]